MDQGIAQRIVAALEPGDSLRGGVLEIGPGMGVLTQYLLKREDIDLKMIELDDESVNYLLTHFNGMQGRLFLGDYLKMNIHHLFEGSYRIIGNFPYNISSQIFFKILDDRDRVPEVVCMIQKEVAERIAEGPGSKTYGILSVLLQAWYDIEYLFTQCAEANAESGGGGLRGVHRRSGLRPARRKTQRGGFHCINRKMQ